nr:selenocysteine methyltransferase-like [Coffea arabica]
MFSILVKIYNGLFQVVIALKATIKKQVMIALKATIKRQVHLDYHEVGANIIISVSYQATLQGFVAKGISREEGEALLRKIVEIACDVRDIYYYKASKGSWDVIGDPKALNVHSLLLLLLEAMELILLMVLNIETFPLEHL